MEKEISKQLALVELLGLMEGQRQSKKNVFVKEREILDFTRRRDIMEYVVIHGKLQANQHISNRKIEFQAIIGIEGGTGIISEEWKQGSKYRILVWRGYV